MMNPIHTEIFVDYLTAANPAVSRDMAINKGEELVKWFGPSLFEKVMTHQNAQDFCVIVDVLMNQKRLGATSEEALAYLCRLGARGHYTTATLKKFESWMEPKEIPKVKRPSMGNVVMMR